MRKVGHGSRKGLKSSSPTLTPGCEPSHPHLGTSCLCWDTRSARNRNSAKAHSSSRGYVARPCSPQLPLVGSVLAADFQVCPHPASLLQIKTLVARSVHTGQFDVSPPTRCPTSAGVLVVSVPFEMQCLGPGTIPQCGLCQRGTWEPPSLCAQCSWGHRK